MEGEGSRAQIGVTHRHIDPAKQSDLISHQFSFSEQFLQARPLLAFNPEIQTTIGHNRCSVPGERLQTEIARRVCWNLNGTGSIPLKGRAGYLMPYFCVGDFESTGWESVLRTIILHRQNNDMCLISPKS